MIRKIRFKEAMTATILSNHRRVAPFGLAGGECRAPGRNRVIRAQGGIETLDSTTIVQMQPGDIFGIETPGGGFGHDGIPEKPIPLKPDN